MKYSLLPLSVACVIGSAFGNLCDFVLDAESLQSSVFDTNTPALVAYTREDEEQTHHLMEGPLASLGELGFCVGTFDCSNPKHSKQCSITAGNFPFLSLYLDEPKKNPYTKKNYRDFTPYMPKDNSPETIRKIDKFVAKSLGSAGIVIGDSEEVVASQLTPQVVSSTAQVVLLSTKTQTSLLWRRIAFHFKNRLQFVQIKADAEWLEESGLLKLALGEEVTVPSVLVRPEGAGEADLPLPKYSGDMKSYDDLVAWLTPFAGAAPAPSSPNEDSESASSKDKDKSKSAIKALSADEFAAILTDSSAEEGVHVVSVRQSGVPEPDLAALRKKCYGAVFCEEFVCEGGLEETVARFCPESGGGIPSEPYLLVVPYTPADRAKLLAAPSKWILKSDAKEEAAGEGAAGVFSAEVQAAAAKKALESFPESLAVPIDETQMQNFLGACVQEQVFGMLVLASAGKSSPPAMLRHVAAVHKDMTKVAYVSNPSPQFLKQFGISEATFPMALGMVQPLEGDQFQVMYYDKEHFGAMNFRSLTSFVYNVIEGVPGMKDLYIKKMNAKQESAPPPADSAPDSGPSVLTHVTSQEQWEQQCGPAFKGICAVGFVGAPELSSGEYSADSVSIFETLMNSLSHHMKASFRFVWMDIACQAKLAENFDLTPDTSPGLVMYSPLKKRYATYIGNFKQESLAAFASGMLRSKISTFPIRGDDVVYDDAVNCLAASEEAAASSGGGQEENAEDMEDFLAEIKAEEQQRADALAAELAAEKAAAAAEKAEQEAKSKKNKKKKKKKKKSKKEL